MDNGSIHDYIHVKGHKPEIDQSVLWAQQIAEGMVDHREWYINF